MEVSRIKRARKKLQINYLGHLPYPCRCCFSIPAEAGSVALVSWRPAGATIFRSSSTWHIGRPLKRRMGGRNKVSKKKTNTQKNGYIAYVCVSPICAKTKKKTQRRTVSPSALHLASAYYQLRTLCIWSLTKLLRIGLKSPFFIHRIIIYIHAIHHRQILNFLKLFCLEDGKKVSNTWQTVLSESNTTRNVRVSKLFQFSCSIECRQSSFSLLKWRIFSKYSIVTTK